MKEDNNGAKYSPLKIQQLKMWLEDMKEKGETKYIEVFVDDLKVVPRTEAIEEIDKLEQYIDEESQKITILIFNTPKSNRYKQNTYVLKEKGSHGADNKTLSGIEIQNAITEKIDQAKKEWAFEQLKKDLETKKEKLSEAENYIEKLKGIIADTKQKLQDAKSLNDFTSILKDLAPQFLSLNKTPAGNLSGAEKKPETEASFSKAEDTKGLSDDEKHFLHIGKMIEEKFIPEELLIVYPVIDALAEDKKNIKRVAELLNINHNQQKQTTK